MQSLRARAPSTPGWTTLAHVTDASRVVVLFDIDGTLVDCRGAGRAAMRDGFARITGRADAVDHVGFGGMTDRSIARIGLGAVGHDTSEESVDAVLRAYLEALPARLAAEPRVRLIPGAAELVASATVAGFRVGLGTGNLREGARLKLLRLELWSAFSFGGFGCDAEERAELLRIGYERGRAGATGERSSCVVIGDTPRDISAARAIGARVVAVATGSVSKGELASHGPDLAVDSLTDERVSEFLHDCRPDSTR